MNYTLFVAGEAGAAGLMAAPDGVRPGWIGYVAVDDVDASAGRFAAAGGAVHKAPADIPEVGRIAVVADPQGAVIALITPLPGDGHMPAPHTPGHGGWRELLATDLEPAFKFYAGEFGWTKGDHVDMGPMGIYQLFSKGAWATPADALGGMMTRPPSVPAPFWVYYFNVDDIRAAEARIRSAGGQVDQRPARGAGRQLDRSGCRSAGRNVRARPAAEGRAPGRTSMSYIDGFVIPVPDGNKQAYL